MKYIFNSAAVFATFLSLVACESGPKHSANPGGRTPANTQAFVDGSEKILKDLNNPSVFNENTCFDYVDSLTTTVFALPSDYFFPRSAAEVELLKTRGPVILQTLFNSRLKLQESVKEFTKDGQVDLKCINAIREGNQFLRYAEDFMLEWLVENDVVESTPPQILEQKFPHTIVNEKFKGFELRAGDVMIVRGKSYVSAMIARIGDEEGNFSHLAIVAQDKNGKLYAAESLIQQGLIVTPLEKWLKTEDARVALYRYPDQQVAQKASRVIYDHAMSYINKKTTKPYDFAMDDSESESFFCSEVVKWAYEQGSNKTVIVPMFRSQATKFNNTSFFKSMGIKKGSLFAPFDMEVDPRFDFIAEYRFLPLLRQVRMQDSVLQSMYSWMVKSDYDFYAAPNLSVKAAIAKIVRQFGIAKDKLPTYMPYDTLLTTLKYEVVATALEKNLYAKEREYYKIHGHSMTFKDLMGINDEYRINDCELEKEFQKANLEREKGHIQARPSEFHWFFKNKKAKSCALN